VPLMLRAAEHHIGADPWLAFARRGRCPAPRGL